MPRGKRSRIMERKAATEGLKEVESELNGNMAAASKFGEREKRERRGPQRAPRSNGATRNGALNAPATKGMYDLPIAYPAQPTPKMATLFDGQQVTTDVYRDRIFTGKPQVIITNSTGVFISVVTGFQTNNPVKEPLIETTIGTWLSQMYSMIVRNYQAKTGRIVRDTVLDTPGTPGGATEGSIALWLSAYSSAYMQLRGLEGWLSVGNFNQTCAAISSNIDQLRWRLVADLRRLYEYKVPAKWNAMLDRLCGPIIIDSDATVVGLQLGTLGAAVDLTTQATVTSILTTAESNLSVLAFPGATANNNDFARIANIFTLAYGSEPQPTAKRPSNDMADYLMFYGQGVTYVDTTANLAFTWPNLNATLGTIPMIPIVAPKSGYSKESFEQLFTCFRMALVSNDPVAGEASANLANQIGILGNQSLASVGSATTFYPQTGVAAFTTDNGAGAGTVTIANVRNSRFWIAQSQLENANYGGLGKANYDVDVYYVQYNNILDQTLRMLEDTWLGPVTP